MTLPLGPCSDAGHGACRVLKIASQAYYRCFAEPVTSADSLQITGRRAVDAHRVSSSSIIGCSPTRPAKKATSWLIARRPAWCGPGWSRTSRPGTDPSRRPTPGRSNARYHPELPVRYSAVERVLHRKGEMTGHASGSTAVAPAGSRTVLAARHFCLLLSR